MTLGVAHLWEQNALRFLGSFALVSEAERSPAVNLSAGVQGIGVGNPGYSATAEKNFKQSFGSINIYAGVGLRSNENHIHGVGGIKFAFENGFVLGIQDDGHRSNPFLTYSKDQWTMGIYVVGWERIAYLVGVRF